MTYLRTICLLFSLILPVFSRGSDVRDIFPNATANIKKYYGLFTKNMQQDMWILVSIVFCFTFLLSFGLYAFGYMLLCTSECFKKK